MRPRMRGNGAAADRLALAVAPTAGTRLKQATTCNLRGAGEIQRQDTYYPRPVLLASVASAIPFMMPNSSSGRLPSSSRATRT